MRKTLAAAVAASTVAVGLAVAGAYAAPQSAQAGQQQRAEASAAAWVQYLELASVDPHADFMSHARDLRLAATPADYAVLRERWAIETATARLELETLSAASGGLKAGLPVDILDLERSIEGAAADADAAGITTEPAADLRQAAAAYSELPASGLLAEHDSLRDLLAAGLQTISTRVDARHEATSLAARIDDLLAQASAAGIPSDLAQQVADAKALSAAARSDEDVRAADQKLRSATTALNAIINRIPSAPLPPCLGAGQPRYLISIHLSTQQLVAYQDGCPWLATPVTTGRPALPTDRGTFSIFYKTYAYKMVSPWPQGSPYYYPPTWVYYAMEFVGDGTFIHNADWQPDGSYGPGSQYGPFASHGCVHVRDSVLPSLYAWAPIGTTVVVGD